MTPMMTKLHGPPYGLGGEQGDPIALEDAQAYADRVLHPGQSLTIHDDDGEVVAWYEADLMGAPGAFRVRCARAVLRRMA